MSFIPKNTKFMKVQKKKIKNLTSTNTDLVFGTVGLKIAENGFLTSKQLDMLKFFLAKNLKKQGQY
jgi:ribosomal protein L16/L10AE